MQFVFLGLVHSDGLPTWSNTCFWSYFCLRLCSECFGWCLDVCYRSFCSASGLSRCEGFQGIIWAAKANQVLGLMVTVLLWWHSMTGCQLKKCHSSKPGCGVLYINRWRIDRVLQALLPVDSSFLQCSVVQEQGVYYRLWMDIRQLGSFLCVWQLDSGDSSRYLSTIWLLINCFFLMANII